MDITPWQRYMWPHKVFASVVYGSEKDILFSCYAIYYSLNLVSKKPFSCSSYLLQALTT